MGIYLPNVEMPASCRECRFCNGHANTDCGVCACCGVDGKTRDAYTREDCPLVPVPPHGRLGDLDEINEKHDKLSRDFCHGYFKSTWDFVCAARKLFYDAPTIIPASGGQENE